MEFRLASAGDLPQVMGLWDYCFEKKEDPFFQWYFREYCLQHNKVVGGFDEEGRLRNMLHLNPYQVLLRGRVAEMPYIVGVATDPAARGHHLTEGLLDAAFALLRARHVAFALLMPIYAGIYQPYGFAFCYKKHAYDLPLADLRVPAPVGEVRLERSARLDRHLLEDVYADSAARYNGLAVRTDFQWDKLLTTHSLEHVQTALACEEGRPTGYMLYKILDDRTFFVQELLASTADARLALLRFSRAHLSAADRFVWQAPADDVTYLHFPDASRSGSVKPAMMARCLDVVQALADYEAPPSCPDLDLTLAVQDPQIGANNRLLSLSVRRGQLLLRDGEDETPAVLLDIGVFTQLCFGACEAERLEAAGLLHTVDPTATAALAALFPPCVNYINEDY